ncbi:MAG: SBBP repeat-containing protein [candidate division WOR-3 bacterium]|nr:SBBP repeat-containing protein [candidate division WOR-3 bacterium]
MKNLLLFALLLLLVTNLFAQVDTVWVRRWTSPGYESDWAYAIAADNLGNVYVTGNNGFGNYSQWTTIKYTADGDTAWVRYINNGNYNERGNLIVIGPFGNIYITGYTMSSGDGDYYTVKYRPNGDTAWTRRYNGPNPTDGYDFANVIAVDEEENVYVTGYSQSASYDFDYATVKYDSSGVQQWVARYNGSGNGTDHAEAIAVDNSGYVYVTGYSNPYSSGTIYDYVTIKYNPTNGDTLWVRKYNYADSSDAAFDIAVDGSGNAYVTGRSKGLGTGSDIATIKYYPNGDTAWVRRYNGPVGNGGDTGYGVEVDALGNVYVAGSSAGVGTGTDIVMIKYNSSGEEQWVTRYNGPANGTDAIYDDGGGKCLKLDQFADVYVVGYSMDSESTRTRQDYLTIKYNSDGIEQWHATYNHLDSCIDVPTAIAVDNSGYIYVTGRSQTEPVSYIDWATIKYRQTPGVEERSTLKALRSTPEIYPNPARSVIRVRVPYVGATSLSQQSGSGNPSYKKEEMNLKIFDVSGKLITETEISSPETQISLTGIKPGVYFLQLGTETMTKKFIVSK